MAKYRLNPFTSELDDSGAIVGLKPAINFSDSAQDLGDWLESTSKPYFNAVQATVLYLDQDAGSDTNTGLAANVAVASIGKVTQLIHSVYSSTQVVVNVAWSASPYIVPFGFAQLHNTLWLGAQTIEYTRNVVANVTTNDNWGCEFTADGAQIPDDELSGRILSVTNQLSNSRNINVVRNTWNGTRNVIYGAMHNRGFLSDIQTALTSAADINVLKLPEFQFPASTVFTQGIDLNFSYLKITGGSIFINGAAKPQFLRCEIACDQIVAGNSGTSPYILSCAIANKGNTTNGILAARTKGTMRLGYGNVYVPKNLTNAAFMKIKCAEGGTIEWENGGIFRGLTSAGIFFDGASSSPVARTNLSMHFEKQSGTASCVAAYVVNPANTTSGTYLGFSKSTGELTGNYAVSAQRGAYINYDTASSLVTALGTNYLSASGGTATNAQGADGTIIVGGYPAYAAEFNAQTNITFADSPYTVNLSNTELLQVNTTGGVVVVLLPAASANSTGGTLIIKRLNNVSVNQVSVTPAGADTIDLVAGVTAIAAAGGVLRLCTDGVANWNAI